MGGNKLRLGRVLGIELKLDYSWFIVFFLVTWSLASHYFPMAHSGWPTSTYWSMALVTSALFFISIVTHELAHSVVSQAFGVPVRDITLFIFGGAAHISEEPRRARDELLMALAGPATSLALAAFFGLVWWATRAADGPPHAVAGWLAWINMAVGLFNLVPGFPLDGGRVFRAIVWSATGNLRRATAAASGLGRLIAFGFIVWGIWQIFDGNWANGLWIAFIGWFLDSAAASSYQRLALQDALAGHTAREAMMSDCPTVRRRLTLDVLVDQVVLPSGRRCFPVVEDGQLDGLLTLQRIKAVPRERWTSMRVEDVMIPRGELKTVRPDEDLNSVFERMVEEDVNQFPVMDDGRLAGMIARDNVLNFIRLRTEMGAT